MVRLSKIYTKTGDDGSTGLGNGSRVAKHDPRVEAYGTVDEANAALGACVVAARADVSPYAADMVRLLTAIQNDLFDVGADLCCPIEPGEVAGSRLRVTAAQTEHLERAIDAHNERLKPLDSFVLPGGSPLAVSLHMARTIVRRAERRTVELVEAPQGLAATSREPVRYLNRLSDLLFVLARVANADGKDDVKWVPGANRR